jgi:hypothetical protein
MSKIIIFAFDNEETDFKSRISIEKNDESATDEIIIIDTGTGVPAYGGPGDGTPYHMGAGTAQCHGFHAGAWPKCGSLLVTSFPD